MVLADSSLLPKGSLKQENRKDVVPGNRSTWQAAYHLLVR
jgi:hypothetical protein